MFRFATVVSALVLALATAGASEAPLTIRLSSGQIEGVDQGASIAFLGVPYAQPPIGEARWRAPAAVAPWSGVRKADAFAPSCPQIINPPEGRAPWTPEYLIPGATSEDCLYLNVWRPADARVRRAPVLVWFHGGGMVEGSGSVPAYDGAALASHGIVVITVNYRLGVLGFLALPELDGEQGAQAGNYGLQDMLAALHWIRTNAAALGADPGRVTIAGQSGGSDAVNDLTGAPGARGLFSGTVTESGSGWNPRLPSRSQAEARGQSFAAALGAGSLQALRALNADMLVQRAAQLKLRFGAYVDGHLLPMDPIAAQGTRQFNDTPVMSGFNFDEESGFDKLYGQWSVAEFTAKRDGLFGPVAHEAAGLYNAVDDAQAHEIGKIMMRDHSRAYSYEWARRRAAVSRNPIFLYEYAHPEPGPTQERYGTFHTAEVPYVFGNLDAPRPFTEQDRQVSRQMMARWLAFIKTGSPNAAGLPHWPRFEVAQPMLMRLGDQVEAEELLPKEKRQLSDLQVEKDGYMNPRGPDSAIAR